MTTACIIAKLQSLIKKTLKQVQGLNCKILPTKVTPAKVDFKPIIAYI